MISLSIFASGLLIVGYCVGRAHAAFIEHEDFE
jgi:hypothetical protein